MIRHTRLKSVSAKRAAADPRARFSTFSAKPKRVKPKNAKRRQSEFARCYGSRARVAFVKGLPCLVCAVIHPAFVLSAGPSDNAHTENGGKGRKGPFTSIVPLCRNHHRRYDEHRAPFDQSAARDVFKIAGPLIEARWQAHLAGSPAPTDGER